MVTAKIADGINETVLLPLPTARHWLCVGRTSNRPAPEHGQELRQLRSTDDGATWSDEGLIAGWHLHPPHLLRLKDGRILLTYGNRRDSAIDSRLSADDGKTWSAPQRHFTTGSGDITLCCSRVGLLTLTTELTVGFERFANMAEGVGFEPTVRLATSVSPPS